ncbi:glycosyltransferase family 2 protein [Alishewanella tabrizica]|uniref:Glycosyltransferase 2-like domain-containing protein n=1 Tax=Alishewanella tabrizica TaxID=671278 RepID=A0ABQ2WHD2_9ALTE|nr:glycosyltransferase [Alishewanella tabrizica]GGW55030.1 hypothetical protein GCM10008111_08820 [Alishewanella tabrizica]
MDQTISLSLIVPFYNVGENFVPLLASLEQQLLPGVEAVLICDGATDDSLAIAQQHIAASQAPFRYQLIVQANAGVSAARNSGIQHARGQYIGFVDADDVLLDDYSENVLGVISKHQPDLIEIGYKRFRSLADLPHSKARYLHRYSGLQPCRQVALTVFKANRWFSVLRFYRKDKIPHFAFPLGVGFCEDLIAIPALYQYAQTVFCIKKPLYGYREHAASATFNVKPASLQALKSFSSELANQQHYAALPSQWCGILQFNLAYLLLKLHKTTQQQEALSPAFLGYIRKLALTHWLTPGLSIRKKWRLTFPGSVYRPNKSE